MLPTVFSSQKREEVQRSKEDPVFQQLLSWNSGIQQELDQLKQEYSDMSKQMLALIQKQIQLQEDKLKLEETNTSLQRDIEKLKNVINKLSRENRMMRFRIHACNQGPIRIDLDQKFDFQSNLDNKT